MLLYLEMERKGALIWPIFKTAQESVAIYIVSKFKNAFLTRILQCKQSDCGHQTFNNLNILALLQLSFSNTRQSWFFFCLFVSCPLTHFSLTWICKRTSSFSKEGEVCGLLNVYPTLQWWNIKVYRATFALETTGISSQCRLLQTHTEKTSCIGSALQHHFYFSTFLIIIRARNLDTIWI